jgi:hypothetical protein
MTHLRWLPLVALLLSVVPASAGAFDASPSYRPSVPVSAFARPADWLDMSRFHVSAEFMMGTGFGGGTNGLQVTRLQYQIANPLAVRVSLGDAFGAGMDRNSSSMFLEGLDLSYRPFSSFMVQFHYQDVRTPLQYSRNGAYDFWR